MRILVIGSQAREHAIVKALHRSPQKPYLFCCGTTHNPGIQALTLEYRVVDICEPTVIASLAKAWDIELAIIGPGAPLEAGVADALWAAKIPTVGPTKALAQVETSKAFTRELMRKYQITGSPEHRIFKDLEGAKDYLHHLGENRYVIKPDGMMDDQRVKVGGEHLHSLREAFEYCQWLHEQNQTFIVEEKLTGQEFSLLCFSDGNILIPMPVIQDHKRAFIDDKGPNTGGMGCYSDANHSLPFLTSRDVEKALLINEEIVAAVTAEYRERYVGVVYGSFIATKDGVKLIEFNARFGDPEAMSLLAILNTDFVDINYAMAKGKLQPSQVSFSNLATVCKYAVPEGYPDILQQKIPIDVTLVQNPSELYYSAVDIQSGILYATGERAVAVVGIAPTILDAERIAEAEISRVRGNLYHREDIGTRDLINARILQMQKLRQREYHLL